jgi:TRAP-type mannitol/chloroaromatic compound transport system permease small subunit
VNALLALSQHIDRLIARIASLAGWLFLALTGVILVDVVTRKFGFQLPNFGSTRLQELEGHLHAALFAFWLGFAYIKNAHVRIDVALTRASPRALALLELGGCILLALPFTLIAAFFAFDYAWISFRQNEASVSASGLPYLFIPKAALALGVLLLLVAVLSIMLRTLVFLWGSPELRERAGFAAYKMGPRQ